MLHEEKVWSLLLIYEMEYLIKKETFKIASTLNDNLSKIMATKWTL